MRVKVVTACSTLTLLLPAVVHAQGLQPLVDTAVDLINFTIAILIGVAIIAFFWGLVKYLFVSQGDSVAQKQATQLMMWGLLALFFMLSVYGIIRMLQVTFGVGGAASVNAPAIKESTLQACSPPFTQNFGCFAQWIARMFGVGTALLVGGALAVYFWGIAYHMFGYSTSGNSTSAKKLRDTILWGLLALFVMFSIWGIIRILGVTLFGTNNFNALW